MAGQLAGGTGLSTGETLGVLFTSPDPFKTFIDLKQQKQQQTAVQGAVNAYTNPNIVEDQGVPFDKTLGMMDPSKVGALPQASQQTRGRMALEQLARAPGTADLVAKTLASNSVPLTPDKRYQNVPNVGLVDLAGPNGPSVAMAAPKDLPASIQEAIFANNGDMEKAKEQLKNKGMDGEWAVGPNGRTSYVPKSFLMSEAGAGYSKIPTGMKMVSDGQGGFTFATGDMAGSSDLTTPVKTDIQKSILQGQDAVARLESIKQKFKPEYQQLGTRWNALASDIKDKAGFKLDEDTAQQLSDFSSYQREVTANTNQTIKDLTGATVGADEAPRLMLQMPVAGQGLFDGDGPTRFQSKLDGTLKSIKAANARQAYALKNGLNKTQQFAIPLDSIPTLIDKKGEQYTAELKRANPTADAAQIKAMVMNRLREEFKIGN